MKYSDGDKADIRLKSDLLDELGIDDEESQITFNFQNLNYVKRKLFDPEINYLMTKFKEAVAEHKIELLAKNTALIEDYKAKIKEEMTIATAVHEETTVELAGIKRFNVQITEVMESVISKVETCELELQHE